MFYAGMRSFGAPSRRRDGHLHRIACLARYFAQSCRRGALAMRRFAGGGWLCSTRIRPHSAHQRFSRRTRRLARLLSGCYRDDSRHFRRHLAGNLPHHSRGVPGARRVQLFALPYRYQRYGYRRCSAAHRTATPRGKSPAENLRPRRAGLRRETSRFITASATACVSSRTTTNSTGTSPATIGMFPSNPQAPTSSCPRGSPGCTPPTSPAFSARARRSPRSKSSAATSMSSTQRPLAFHEGLTVVAGWDKGFVHEPLRFRKGRAISAKQLAALHSRWRASAHVCGSGIRAAGIRG